MRILLIGPQGSGKSTIGSMLSQQLNVPLITPGELLRDLPPSHPFYDSVNNSMEKGDLVPWEQAALIVSDRLAKPDCVNGYILDGWGRDLEQFEYFDPEVDVALFINVSKNTTIKRVTGRRICPQDDFVCNIYANSDSILSCEKCKGELIQREDDTEVALNKRLEIFYTKTMQVVEYFRKKGKLFEVSGEPLPEEIVTTVLTGLKGKYVLN